MEDLLQFFESAHYGLIHYKSREGEPKVGDHIRIVSEFTGNIGDEQVVLLGCGECRGRKKGGSWENAADKVREQLYHMYGWHPSVTIADMGNLMQGRSIQDTKAILTTILKELSEAGKIVILIGGSHDLMMQQYEAFRQQQRMTSIASIDMLIDLEDSEGLHDRNYLMEMLTGEPNFVRNYSHLAFQSYFVNPHILETLDKLRFDFYRLGRVRSALHEMEPVLRSCDLLGIDMNVLRYSEASFNKEASPNGLFGDELCQLVRYAGMSTNLTSIGIYNYHPEEDTNGQGAILIAQMLWYFMDGLYVRNNEADIRHPEGYTEYQIPGQDTASRFRKSKRTNRWWMALPDGQFIPCSYEDYVTASNNEIPEIWLREQERLL